MTCGGVYWKVYEPGDGDTVSTVICSPASCLSVCGLRRVRVLWAWYRGRSGVVSRLGMGRLGPCQELSWIPSDEACPALKGHVGPHPREHYEYTVTKSNQEEEVYGHPREP